MARPRLIPASANARARAPPRRRRRAGQGTARARAEALAAQLGVRDRLHFLGWVDDLPRFYATVDVFALSSLNEGTPVAVIEAMAAARAVVATAVGGVPDVVEPGVTGLLVPAQDPDAMAAALLELATDPDRRAALGGEGRRRARERYSHVRLVDEIEALYVRELAQKRGTRT
jgi:glycosyltransferase involved in cell wall biosynthesis